MAEAALVEAALHYPCQPARRARRRSGGAASALISQPFSDFRRRMAATPRLEGIRDLVDGFNFRTGLLRASAAGRDPLDCCRDASGNADAEADRY
jgi:hypothetical protein